MALHLADDGECFDAGRHSARTEQYAVAVEDLNRQRNVGQRANVIEAHHSEAIEGSGGDQAVPREDARKKSRRAERHPVRLHLDDGEPIKDRATHLLLIHRLEIAALRCFSLQLRIIQWRDSCDHAHADVSFRSYATRYERMAKRVWVLIPPPSA